MYIYLAGSADLTWVTWKIVATVTFEIHRVISKLIDSKIHANCSGNQFGIFNETAARYIPLD